MTISDFTCPTGMMMIKGSDAGEGFWVSVAAFLATTAYSLREHGREKCKVTERAFQTACMLAEATPVRVQAALIRFL